MSLTDDVHASIQAREATARQGQYIPRLAQLSANASDLMAAQPRPSFLDFRTDTDVVPTSSGIKVP